MGIMQRILGFIFLPLRVIFGGFFKFVHASKRKVWQSVFLIIIFGIVLASFDYPRYWDGAANAWNGHFDFIKLPGMHKRPFRLGLDLQGGTHLIYRTDVSEIDLSNRADALEGVRDVIERRVNLFGVSEPIVQVNHAGNEFRLIVELAGVHDIAEAIRLIGETPLLEFKEQRPVERGDAMIKEKLGGKGKSVTASILCLPGNTPALVQFIKQYSEDPCYVASHLTGRHLKRSQVSFDQQTGEPQVDLTLNSEGKDIFADLTRRNVGKIVAIYLDGYPISVPVVKNEITQGRAVISGNFSVQEARQLVKRLNAGALPVPISLVSQQSVGATLGHDSFVKSLRAGIYGFLFVIIFMAAWYRLPGLISVFALGIYISLVLAIFKLIPVTLTLAGIAGFILSMGMAVDANVLIFERMREELRAGRTLTNAVEEGFRRSWPSIRDGNISTLITTLILYWFGTSIIQGFALTLAIGILASMFSAIVVTRMLLRFFIGPRLERHRRLFANV